MRYGAARLLLLAGLFAVQTATGCVTMAEAQGSSEPDTRSADQPEKGSGQTSETGSAQRVVPLEPLPVAPVPEQSNGEENGAERSEKDRIVPLEPLAARRAAVAEPLREAVVPSTVAVSEVSAAEATVRDWAAAWAAQRVDDYLLFYSREFRPPEALTRSRWEAQRRHRISRPAFIEVRLDALTVRFGGPGIAWVEFAQAYRSDSYRDDVVKILQLQREDGLWKITAEQVIRQLPANG
ncbi:MAG: hypothetical protein AAF657_15530 [Acidobacteriota bacterium]